MFVIVRKKRKQTKMQERSETVKLDMEDVELHDVPPAYGEHENVFPRK